MELSGVHTDSDQDSEQEISNFAHDFNQHGHGDVGLDPSTSDGAALLGEMGAIEKKKKQKCSDLNTYTKWAIIARHTEEINRKNDRLYTGEITSRTFFVFNHKFRVEFISIMLLIYSIDSIFNDMSRGVGGAHTRIFSEQAHDPAHRVGVPGADRRGREGARHVQQEEGPRTG